MYQNHVPYDNAKTFSFLLPIPRIFFRFRDIWLLRGEAVSPRQTPNLQDQFSVFMTPQTGWPGYTPKALDSSGPRDSHFPCLQ
jgi:hypothetical protein